MPPATMLPCVFGSAGSPVRDKPRPYRAEHRAAKGKPVRRKTMLDFVFIGSFRSVFHASRHVPARRARRR